MENTVKINIINPIDIPDWNDLIVHFPGNSIYHSREWAAVIYQTYEYEPHYFLIKQAEECIAILPFFYIKSFITGKRFVSLPFSDYCEPLLKNKIDFPAIWQKVLSALENDPFKTVEIRGGGALDWPTEKYTTYLHHVLKIDSDTDALAKKFRSSTNRNIKKGSKNNITVEFSNSSAAIDIFYKLNCLTRKKHGLPPQPLNFFKNIYNHILKNGLGIIGIAFHNQQPVGANVYFHWADTFYYKYGASDTEAQVLRANNLLMWEGIKYAAEREYKYFCFGRTEPANKGLRQFKMGWGVEETELHYYLYDLRINAFIAKNLQESGGHTKLFRQLPLPVLRSIGQVLYKHVG